MPSLFISACVYEFPFYPGRQRWKEKKRVVQRSDMTAA